MLISLTVKNYAVIADAEIQFGRGLNILTGETGAGKSIILGALATILGDRVDTSVLRARADKAIIEGHFDISNNAVLEAYLQEHGLQDQAEDLWLRREIHQNGRTRAFINDTPVQLSVLQEVGDWLVDLHGQHEHQSLLKVQSHLRFLDQYGDLEMAVRGLASAFKRLQKLSLQLQEVEQRQKNVQEKSDFYSFQIDEISKVNPTAEEEQELLKEEKIIQHSERLYNLTQELSRILYDDHASIFDQLSHLQTGLLELEGIDDSFSQYKKECESVRLIIEEMAKAFQTYGSKIEFNPQRLEAIQNRISELSGLKKKYGRDLKGILEYREQISEELARFESLADEIAAVRQEIEAEKATLTRLSLDLSQKRQAVADKVQSLIPEVLAYLGMPGSRFKVVLKYQDDPNGAVTVQGRPVRVNASGIDFAEFMISTNVGEEERPLAKVASGGEISRIMLALKSIMAKQGQVPVLIFDEIDIGVSGRMARAVGRKLRELSDFHQVICITHLPQIASMGHHHYLVEKTERTGRMETTIRKLAAAEIEEAIAKLLAGESVSEAHLNSARELLQDAVVT
ncbi:MAG: DNA repair protein RecN [bacterium]